MASDKISDLMWFVLVVEQQFFSGSGKIWPT